MTDRKQVKANNQNQMEPEEPIARRFFRPWEDRDNQNYTMNSQRPYVITPPAANSLNYWPQPTIPAAAWWTRFMPSRATGVSTHAIPQPLPVPPASTLQTTVLQMPQRKRKRVAQDKEEEQLVKRVYQMSREEIEKELPYRREMARTFAPKERTPEEQRKRDKNTEACRLSRQRKKFLEKLKEDLKYSKFGL